MAIRSRVGVQVDTTGLQAHLQDYVKIMGKEMSVVIKEQAGLFCRDMASYTRPFATRDGGGTGLTMPAKKAGQDNVRLSAKKVFAPIDMATNEQIASIGSYEVFKIWEKRNGGAGPASGRKIRWTQFQAKYDTGKSTPYFASGNFSAMRRYINGLRDDQGHGGLKKFVKNTKGHFAIVQSEKDIERFIYQKDNNVGILKSAYWFAAERIGAKINVPAWAKRTQGETNAIAEDHTKQSTATPDVVVGNTIGNKLGNERWTRIAIQQRAYKMRNQMAAYMNKNKIPWWKASNTWQHFDIK